MKNALPSKKQHALLEFIDGFIKENNFAPSYREVMRALDYKSVSTVASHIEGLIARGWLVKRENSARSVEVVYKAGEAGRVQDNSGPTVSPAPSLSDANHEAWLKARIEARLADTSRPLSEQERTSIQQTLTVLDLGGLLDQPAVE